MRRTIDELDPAEIVPFEYGGAGHTPPPDTPDDAGASPDGENWHQLLLESLNRLNQTLDVEQRHQADQSPRSEKLQPATNLADLLPQPQHPETEQPEPDTPDTPDPEPVEVTETVTASAPSGFQQQQRAGAVDMGQGLNAGADVLGQTQALLQSIQESNQKTIQILQTIGGIVTQQLQAQQQFSHDLEQMGQQFEGLKAAVEAVAEEVHAGQQRSPQNWQQNP